MKKLFLLLLILLCIYNVNAFSPFTLKYVKGKTNYELLEDIVFQIPEDITYMDHCNPDNEDEYDYSVINISSYAISENEIQYMNDGLFSAELLQSVAEKNNKLDLDDISFLIQSNKQAVLLDQTPLYKDTSVYSTQNDYVYNSNVIGESQWYINQWGSDFSNLRIEYDLYFIVRGYLVYIKLSYDNYKDTSLCEMYPSYFIKKNNKFSWKSEALREQFITQEIVHSDTDDYQILQWIRDCYQSIMETIIIREYD